MDGELKASGKSRETEQGDKDKLVAIILTEAEERKSSFSLRDLASSLNVRHESRIQDAIDTLCSLGLLSAVGDKWILADYLDSTIDKPGSKQSEQDRVVDDMVASARQLSIGEQMFSGGELTPSPSHNPGSSNSAIVSNLQPLVKKTSSSLSPVAYDCDNLQVQDNLDKLKIIMEKMKNISSPAKAADIAKMCRIGTSRSDVNRYLYYLKDKGKVCQTENKWSFQQEVSDKDLVVYAAALADRKPPKKQKEKLISGNSTGCEYDCTPSGNCYHMKVENHFHHQSIQIGDGSNVVLNTQGDQIPRP